MGRSKADLLADIAKLAAKVAANKSGQADEIHFIFQQPKAAVIGVGQGQSQRIAELAGAWPWPAEVTQHAAAGLLEDVVRDAVVEAARADPSKREEVAAAVLAEKERVMLENVGEHVFLFEIDNLELKDVPELHVGQCTFFTMSAERMATMKADKRAAIVAVGKWNGDELEQVVEDGMYEWDEQVGKVFAEVNADGAFAYALQIASSRTLLALHFLKMVWRPFDDSAATMVSLAGFGRRRRRGIHFARRASKANYHTQILGDGPGLSFQVNDELVTWFGTFGLPTFNAIAQDASPGDLGRRITAAVHLIGDAMNSTAFRDKAKDQPKLLADDVKAPPAEPGSAPLYWTRQERLLKLVMAAEALFNLHKDEPVGRTVKRRWISIVEGSTKSLEAGFKMQDHVLLKDVFREAYSLRSKVAHGQEAWIPRDLVQALHYFLMVAISRLLEAWAAGVRDDAELERFLEARGLGFDTADAVGHAKPASADF